jgi:hypothetical protein
MKLEKKLARKVGDGWLDKLASRRELAAGTDVLVDKINQLERRVRELESVPARASYAGVWSRGAAYPGAVFVSHKSGLWFSMADTVLEPGVKGSGWTLAVKSHGRSR